MKFDEAINLLEDAVVNWVDLEDKMKPEGPISALGIFNMINTYKGQIEKNKEDIKDWQNKTEYKTPALAKVGIDGLKKTIQKVKDNPKSFKGAKEFSLLSQLIIDAEEGGKIREKMNQDPNEIDENSPTGILVSKGRFLDAAKNDVKLIRKDEKGWIGDSELKDMIEYIVNPEKISSNQRRTNTGLYKLVSDINAFMTQVNKREIIKPETITSLWLKGQMGDLIGRYNDYLEVERAALLFGSDGFDTSNLKPDIKIVFDDAYKYLKFGAYKNYWKNIIGFLFTELNELHKHDEVYNTRSLMFYTSQFYSMACIMNELYGDESYSTKRPKLNIGLFNTGANPAPSHWGFPVLDDQSLQDCRFEYKGDMDEDQKVAFLKQYKPLPFILIYSYFDDNILS